MASNRKNRQFQQGTALVEFSIVFMVFFVLILAIIEFSLVVYDASRLAEATRAAARYAIVNSPACNVLGNQSSDADGGCSPNNHPLACDTTPNDSVSVEIDSCTFPATTPGCKSVELMDQMMLRSSDYSVLSGDGTVRITYACSQTGNPGMSPTIPVVTVEAIDVQHPMIFASILGFNSEDSNSFGSSITLPSFKTSRTGEDMYTAPSP